MDPNNYDPYRYHGFPPQPPPPPAANFAAGYPSYHPPYPPPLGPSSSFSAYPGEVPQPTLYPSYSGHLQYPAAPPPFQPPYSHQYSSHLSYDSHTFPQPTAAPVDPLPPPPATTAPDYPPYGSSPPQHSLEHHASFNPGELRFPPPHSDSFFAAYGGQEAAGHTSVPTVSVVDPVGPNSSNPPPKPPLSQAPLDHLLSSFRISESTTPVSESPSATNPSHSFHQPPRPELYGYSSVSSNSFSWISPSTPSSSSVASFSSASYHAMSFGGSQHVQSMQIVPLKSSNSSLRVLLLHGNLDVWIYSASNLPNMDMFSKTLVSLVGANSKITSDPYVTFSAESAVLGRTYVRSNNENPEWNQHFYVPIAHHVSEIKFTVKDNDVVGSQVIGSIEIPAEQICTGNMVEGTYPILSSGKPHKRAATLRISIKYIPIDSLSMYHQGVEPGPNYIGVPGTYFPLRKGGKVKLYQDAHVPDGCLPEVWMDQGVRYEHGNCWYDICKAISEAKHLIYIAGWSVYHNVRLVRDVVNGSGQNLAELLKAKSKEGVRVLLLVWDDPTSRNILGFKREGVMNTNDEETRRFFKNSFVNVLLCPRSAGKRHGLVKTQEAGFIYTHHQKSVIVDSDAGNFKQKIVAFVGGLDLCKGRYDTPKHPLFSTLETLHKDDYHNPCLMGKNAGGPREPWHDLHSKIDGPAAYDVLQNFEERWRRASKRHRIDKFKKPFDDKLLKTEEIPSIVTRDESQSKYINDDDPESWHVQIFRSIDSNSVKGFPKDPEEASRMNLVCGKNCLIDMSIHTAYVKAIRAAQHFIYMENQYFIGSSYNWSSRKNLGANNLIPMEIALKIANKIKSKQRFSVYIVIPMWPEGVPTDKFTQQILYWQSKTMQMMYETIYEALVEVGLENECSPQDYLNFFCLGNREISVGNDTSLTKLTEANTPTVLAQRNRRFMIYVHSKGMIVDDEYVILGSANINQRSMEGTRDSEIAMGAYQPQHTWARKPSGPRGEVQAYRVSLWAEHTGVIDECFTRPESLECMRKMKEIGEYNWKQFMANVVTEMPGHLIKYPVDVDRKGKVRPLMECEEFPDVGGKICGTFLGIQENLTI